MAPRALPCAWSQTSEHVSISVALRHGGVLCDSETVDIQARVPSRATLMIWMLCGESEFRLSIPLQRAVLLPEPPTLIANARRSHARVTLSKARPREVWTHLAASPAAHGSLITRDGSSDELDHPEDDEDEDDDDNSDNDNEAGGDAADEATLQRAAAAMERGEMGPSTIAALRSEALRAPRAYRAHGLLGHALLHLGRASEAVPPLRRALALAPSAAGLHQIGAHALQLGGRRAEAAGLYRAGLRLVPSDAEAYYQLALLEQSGSDAEDERLLRTALRLRPAFAAASALLSLRLQRDPAPAAGGGRGGGAGSKGKGARRGASKGAGAGVGAGMGTASERRAEAAALARVALALDPSLPTAHVAAGGLRKARAAGQSPLPDDDDDGDDGDDDDDTPPARPPTPGAPPPSPPPPSLPPPRVVGRVACSLGLGLAGAEGARATAAGAAPSCDDDGGGGDGGGGDDGGGGGCCVEVEVAVADGVAVRILEAGLRLQGRLGRAAVDISLRDGAAAMAAADTRARTSASVVSASGAVAAAAAVSAAVADPYGVVLWPAAQAVAAALVALNRTTAPLASLRVLELGAGTGLASLAAARLGAVLALATDRRPEPLSLLRQAAAREAARLGVEMRVRTATLDIVTGAVEDHGSEAAAEEEDDDEADADGIEDEADDAEEEEAAGEAEAEGGGSGALSASRWPATDVIVAADVLYHEATATALARRSVRALRSGRARHLLVGDAGTAAAGRPGRAAFLAALRAEGVPERAARFVEASGWSAGTARHEVLGASDDEPRRVAVGVLRLDAADVTGGGAARRRRRRK